MVVVRVGGSCSRKERRQYFSYQSFIALPPIF